jgi:hypothetical protein
MAENKHAEPFTFTEKDIEDFQKECGKKPMFSIADFNEVLKKKSGNLSYKDIRILVSKVGWLDDSERVKFKDVLVEENLTDEEHKRYTRIYPNPRQFQKYFPSTRGN